MCQHKFLKRKLKGLKNADYLPFVHGMTTIMRRRTSLVKYKWTIQKNQLLIHSNKVNMYRS